MEFQVLLLEGGFKTGWLTQMDAKLPNFESPKGKNNNNKIWTSFSPRRFCDPWSFDMTGHFGPPLDKLKSAVFQLFG